MISVKIGEPTVVLANAVEAARAGRDYAYNGHLGQAATQLKECLALMGSLLGETPEVAPLWHPGTYGMGMRNAHYAWLYLRDAQRETNDEMFHRELEEALKYLKSSLEELGGHLANEVVYNAQTSARAALGHLLRGEDAEVQQARTDIQGAKEILEDLVGREIQSTRLVFGPSFAEVIRSVQSAIEELGATPEGKFRTHIIRALGHLTVALENIPDRPALLAPATT